MGRVADGVTLAGQALASLESMRMGLFHALFVVQLGEASLVAGRLADARGLADRALTLARERKERGHEAYALHLLGELAAHPDSLDVDTAEGRYREALTLASELGMRPLVGHCHLGLGKLYRQTGKRQEAQEHLTTATSMYREMHMRFWLEKAKADAEELA